YFSIVMEGRNGIDHYRQRAGHTPQSHSRASRARSGRSGQVLHSPGRQRGAVAQAARVRVARDRQSPATSRDDRRDERSHGRGCEWPEVARSTTMIGLDTNILVRYLAQDDPIQSPQATEIIERRLSEGNPGFISIVAMAETVWVLDRAYGLM